MPVVSVFFSIVIRMFYREHGVAHFHAEHQGEQASFTFAIASDLASGATAGLYGDAADSQGRCS